MAGDRFTGLLRAEWIKLRTVPRWALAAAGAVVLTVLLAVLTAASASGMSAGGGAGGDRPALPPQHQDQGYFRYIALPADGSLTARVVEQADSHEWAKAGLMLRTSLAPGAEHVAIMVTPKHGVRLRSDFGGTDIAGSAGGAPRWLRLDRSGTAVTGYESTDGESWRRVGTIELAGLTGNAVIGLFVASPDAVEIQRQFGGEIINGAPTIGEATFDGVGAEPVPAGAWRDDNRSALPGDGGVTEFGDTVTLTGSGDVGPMLFADDLTETVLTGALVGLMVLAALAVLFMTAEYRRGMILTTFVASPRRERVLAAKALVLLVATFVAGLVASFGAFLVATPIMSANGVTPPPLAEPSVLRAVVGTAALLAVVAVFSLGVATILRRSAPAITVVLLLLLVPKILGTGLPLSVATWLDRVTPAAGFAIQESVRNYDSAIDPWAGFGVLCAYTVAVLMIAGWRLRHRDA